MEPKSCQLMMEFINLHSCLLLIEIKSLDV